MDECLLDELIHQYMNDEIELEVITEFCDQLEVSTENKQMLIECIECFDIDVLYETLFVKFKEYLTAEEDQKYRDRFQKTFDQAMYREDYLDS